MNDQKIAGVFDRMSPDSAASQRMLAGIMERKSGTEKRAEKLRRPRFPAAAAAVLALLLLAAGTVFAVRDGLFSPKRYTVTLDGGDTLVFTKGSNAAAAESKIAPPYALVQRALTNDEFASLALRTSPEMRCSGSFKQENGSLVTIEGKTGIFSIHMAVPEIAVTDEIVSGRPNTSIVSGIPVDTAYCVMPKNSKGRSLALFSAAFRLGNINIYIEAAGPSTEAGSISRELGMLVQDLVRKGEPDFAGIQYQ